MNNEHKSDLYLQMMNRMFRTHISLLNASFDVYSTLVCSSNNPYNVDTYF